MKVTKSLAVLAAATAGVAFTGTLFAWQGIADATDSPERTTLIPAVSAEDCAKPRSAAAVGACADAGYLTRGEDIQSIDVKAIKDPAQRRFIKAVQNDEPGELSVLVEEITAVDTELIRECWLALTGGTDAPIAPLYCNALVLMADGKIADDEYYDEAELRELKADPADSRTTVGKGRR